MPSEQTPPKVFISYSHDSQQHAARVLKLSDVLCSWGFDCHIDQYELAPANWHTWMQSRIKEADFVLVVCTETYCRRFEGRETRPTGVGWEGGIITTELYQRQQDKAAKFIPVVFSADDHEHIPALLQPTHRHQINIETLDGGNPRANQSSENLCRHLAGKPRAVKPKIGQIIELPPINHREDFDEPVIKPASPIIQPPTPKIVAPPKPQIIHQNFTEDLGKGIKLEMIAIPGGSFLMGSEDFADTKPVHRVTLSPFHIGKFQVTQAQWQAVMKTNPSRFKGDTLPVERVSWTDAFEFCLKLSEKTGNEYRLPTEAEWEYACLAGSTGKYCFGDDEALLEKYAWYNKNSGGKTHPVGQKKTNNWGLCDMQGNVWEWCEDLYGRYSPQLTINPRSGGSGSGRVIRGGSWDNNSVHCQSAARCNDPLDSHLGNLGFRLVRISR
jgi:formylglycine-generating enzyme required for sulfatase activity